MTWMPREWRRWRPRRSACVAVLIPVFAAVFASSTSLPAQNVLSSEAAVPQIARDRLERAAAFSRELFKRATPDEKGRAAFSTLKDVREYWRLRPWEVLHVWNPSPSAPEVNTEAWPTASDAPALRALLGDSAADIRGLALQALARLELPEDVRRVGALLTDTAVALPHLARTVPQSSLSFVRSGDEDDPVPLAWREYTVGEYAGGALVNITGRGFSGGTADGLGFQEWLEAHDLGAESLWYWQRRLDRTRDAIPTLNPLPGEDSKALQARQRQLANAYRAELRKKAVSDLDRLSAEAQAKVLLLTKTLDADELDKPVNTLLPDGILLRIGRERILELLEGRNIWSDCLALPGAKDLLVWRLGKLAPTLLPVRDWPRVREALQTRLSSRAGTPVLVSRLLPAAAAGQVEDPRTREGFLRAALDRAKWDWRLQLISSEMVRTNLEVHWPFLAARFDPDPALGRPERVGALQALSEEPHSTAKLGALVAFLDDPRNAPLITQPLGRMGDDQVRMHAIWALDAFGDVTPNSYVPMRMRDDLHHAERSHAALVELRRLGHALLDRRGGEGPAFGIPPPTSAQASGPVGPPTAGQIVSAPSASDREAVRARLERAIAGTRELFERAQRTATHRISLLEDVQEFWRLRPWEQVYRDGPYGLIVPVAIEDWPTRDHAPALRDLADDSDPAIRGIAVDALGGLGLPQDIRRIGALLTDTAAAVPGLERTGEPGSMSQGSGVENAATSTRWRDRTVGAYARAAVHRMTGRTFVEKFVFNISFPEWLETNDLGWESLWYWEKRLWRERSAIPVISLAPGGVASNDSQRRRLARDEYRANLRKQSASDLSRMTADARAKIHLLTDADIEWDKVTGPVNPVFPDGFTLAIERERILELLEGRNIWRDCLESNAESVLLWRLGRLAPTVLPERDWSHVRDQLETRGSLLPGMPVLVSRLLAAAKPGQGDDPRTREGYLRMSLGRAVGNQRVKFIAEEMVRSNVEGQWPFLAARFDSNPSAAYWERLGVLDALVEAPHSREKLVALVAFVEDERNSGFLTGRGDHFAELPGSRLAWGLYGIVGPAREGLPLDLRNVGRDLANLQRFARFLLAQKREGRSPSEHK